MEDYIVRAMACGGQIRAFAATTKNLVEKARQIHNTSPAATAALGRLLTAGAMMGAMMKGDNDVLTLQIKGSGALGGIVVTADSKARVKGYVHEPMVVLSANDKGKLDVAGAIGPGYISVIKDMGLKEPYVGQVDLVSGEIAEDLTYYFAASEQNPSAVGLGVLMNKDNTVREAGGFIIQVMPFAEEATIARLEKRVAAVTSVTNLLEQGMTPEEILRALLADDDGTDTLTVTDTIPASFYCNCSRERVLRVLASIGRKDLTQIAEEGTPVELNCHFCNTSYTFTVDDVKQLLAQTDETEE